MELYRYYRDRMIREEREAYFALEEAFSAVKSECVTPALPMDKLSSVITRLRLDNPLLFHYKGVSASHAPGAEKYRVKITYTMKKGQYEQSLSDVKKRLEKVMAPCQGLSLAEKELFIHDWLVKNVTYERLERPYSHEVTGAFCHGIAVCEGISKAFKLMCDHAGIASLVAVGRGVSPEEKTGKKSELHAWNIAFLDKISYGVDTTFDLSLSKGRGICYNYYNIPDEKMMADHSDLMFPVPACKTEYKDLYKYRKIRKIKVTKETENA